MKNGSWILAAAAVGIGLYFLTRQKASSGSAAEGSSFSSAPYSDGSAAAPSGIGVPTPATMAGETASKTLKPQEQTQVFSQAALTGSYAGAASITQMPVSFQVSTKKLNSSGGSSGVSKATITPNVVVTGTGEKRLVATQSTYTAMSEGFYKKLQSAGLA